MVRTLVSLRQDQRMQARNAQGAITNAGCVRESVTADWTSARPSAFVAICCRKQEGRGVYPTDISMVVSSCGPLVTALSIHESTSKSTL